MTDTPRLMLITAPDAGPDTAGSALEAALAAAGADGVAAVIVATGRDEATALAAARVLVPVAQAHGAAAIVLNDTRIAGRAGADGVHVETGHGDLVLAIESFRPERIVGAGNLRNRHTAMTAAEAGPDYVFFGRHDGDTHPLPHPKLVDLATWWAPMMNTPAVALAGHSTEGVAQAAATGTEFVAVGRFVWDHPEGPAAAVRQAMAILANGPDAVAPQAAAAPA